MLLRLRSVAAAASRASPALRALSSASQQEAISYPGALRSFFTEELKFVSNVPAIPTYRVMDRAGKLIKDDAPPEGVRLFCPFYLWLLNALFSSFLLCFSA